jgi:hypothetical protein
VQDLQGSELGVAHVPAPVRVGDLVVVGGKVFEAFDVVLLDEAVSVNAIVKVRPVALRREER